MSNRLMHAVRAHASAMDGMQGQPRWGIVQNVDAGNMLARVLLQPEGVLTGWLPVCMPSVGGGWGIVAPPASGQQVMVVPDVGDHDSGVILGGSYSTANMPPQVAATPGAAPNAVQPGEIALVHQSGSYIRMNGDGSVFVSTAGDLNAAVGGNMSATVVGNAAANVTGMVNVTSETSITLSAPEIGLDAPLVTGQLGGAAVQRLATEDFVLNTYAGHTHTGVQPGASTTGTPTTAPNPATDLTVNFKGS